MFIFFFQFFFNSPKIAFALLIICVRVAHLIKLNRLDIDITDHDGSNPHLKKSLVSNGSLLNNNTQSGMGKPVGQKAISGILVPPSTAQSYAAIAHAAAAAAQSNQQRNNSHYLTNHIDTNQYQSSLGQMSQYVTNSNNNLLASSTKSYNNPGFFESTSYSIVIYSHLMFFFYTILYYI